VRPGALLPGIALALLAAPAAGQERLVVKPPSGWVQVIQKAEAGLRTVAFVPKGQTAADWTEMVTFQVALGRADVSPKDAAARLRARWRAACREFVEEEPKLYWDKDYLATRFFMQCRDPKPEAGHGERLKTIEVLGVKAIQGRESFYLIERAWHADENGRGNPFVTADVRKAWLDFLATAELCDARVPGQVCRADSAQSTAGASPGKGRR